MDVMLDAYRVQYATAAQQSRDQCRDSMSLWFSMRSARCDTHDDRSLRRHEKHTVHSSDIAEPYALCSSHTTYLCAQHH